MTVTPPSSPPQGLTGSSYNVATGTFTPADTSPSFPATPVDFRLSPNDAEGGGTQQGPDVIRLDVPQRAAVPAGFLLGRYLGAIDVPGVTSVQKANGLVQIDLDGRFYRYDEQSPEPIPDEDWRYKIDDPARGRSRGDMIDLGDMVDVQQTRPGTFLDAQVFLHAVSDGVAGRGGCASTTPETCFDQIQYEPDKPNTSPGGNYFYGDLRGVNCTTPATPAGPTSCRFTTDNPGGAISAGFVSGSTGGYEVRNVTPGCTIRAYGRIATGSNGLVYRDEAAGTWTFRGSGVGVGNLAFDDRCVYELTAKPNGFGAVFAGQIQTGFAPRPNNAEPQVPDVPMPVVFGLVAAGTMVGVAVRGRRRPCGV